MKQLVFILSIFFICSSTLLSQSTAWFTSSAEAKTFAVDNKVPILLVFAGSDWCKPCMMLKADILQNDVFKLYYPSAFALLYLDFPLQAKHKLSPELSKQNELLAEKYNPSGYFPNLVMIDTQGKVLGSLTYTHQTPAVFINECKQLIRSIQ